MKGIWQDTILGSFVDYRKKRSHNCVIDLHWAQDRNQGGAQGV